MEHRRLLSRLAELLPAMQSRAAALDEQAAFPMADFADLAEAGLLIAPLPTALGGHGLGTEPAGAAPLLATLRLLGHANLSLARLFEAHVNAVRLVVRTGPGLVARMAEDIRAGHLLALWVTDPPGQTVTLSGGVLVGARRFCSGAGHVARAVLTVQDAGDTRLAYVALDDAAHAAPLPAGLAGMRAAKTGQMRFTGAAATPFGAPGDYLREPDFSCGAWRTTAATLGGLDALVEQLGAQLTARGRAADPVQQARFGHALLATEAARLWTTEAASRAEAADPAPDAIAYIGLARLAVENAALDLIALVQRSLGVAALQRGNPVERIARDLATYLRQPAADMVLAEAAAFHLDRFA